MPPIVNEEDVKAFLAAVMDTIKQDGDPEVLNQYRSLFRKQVPFFMRSYVSAYLIQQAQENMSKGRRPPARNHRLLSDDYKAPKHGDAGEGEQKKQSIPEEESVRIFMSVGRNRRIFPREILSLILTETDVKKEDIGLIRILDNYSFVQVRKEWADVIIEALNGKMFRGRPLTVNYARSKTEESDAPDDTDGTDNSGQGKTDALNQIQSSDDFSETSEPTEESEE